MPCVQSLLADFSSLSTTLQYILGAIAFVVISIVLNVLSQVLPIKSSSSPPMVFHIVPFIGSTITYGMDPYKFMFDNRKKYGDVFTFILLGRKMTVALGPKGNDLILNGKLNQVSAEEAYTHLTTPVFGKDVVYDVPNSVLMEQKKFVKFGLSSENLKKYVEMIQDETLKFINRDAAFKAYQDNNPNGGDFHCFQTMSEITILTASRTLQGKEVRDGLDKSFADMYHDLDGGFTPLNFMFPNLPLPSYKRRDVAQKKMSDFYSEIIQRRREEGSHEYDMIASLMECKYKDGRQLKDREIAHIMIALLMAGQHTSSATSSWILFHLGDKPEVVEALYQEQKEKFMKDDGTFEPLNLDDMRDCPILNSVIKETLRLHPPIHSIIRKVINEIPVPQSLSAPSEKSSYVIPKGNFVIACPGVSAVDPLLWNNSNEFEPTRWTTKTKEQELANADETGETVDYGFGAISKGTSSPYQPFGAGRHRCIGEQFAYLQLSTIIATFIRHMTLEAKNGVPPQDYTSMIVLPQPGSRLHFKRRN
ncbi:cytochrome P450 [Wallemia mellicola]|uniref:Cytochrome P450 n=2 Tax=Wallemia mellicola TaxID=1708541 RepID=A0A4T0MBN0_9BASI|nr:cytochrome P450 [Wallemia mellicola CBS 633.66]TIB79569.1 hypothetical protein E3Q23_00189 [Wallemia mellicola]EIM24094.1 cytochrome P450 [Wallemia mellicola CBS 633.66]TIB80188.1 cytochrome P450 [Wallemia mellicola]TIB94698.1 cytochrome P450 [Wallemia mellicola]TIC03638.1 cytochrome P450 [Wallemia mellicola]|eukprot:XP_006955920.1 cytochrome P450 [Wallemia mellicola CBS 633.66]